MFERFTDRARRVVVFAQEEARLLNHDYIGTEHILLGLLAEGEGMAAQALQSLGVTSEAAREQVKQIIGVGEQPATGHVPFTPRAKQVLELSLREALQIGHNYIGTEHFLLGLITEGGGVALQVLERLGVDLDEARRKVLDLLGDSGERIVMEPPWQYPMSRGSGAPRTPNQYEPALVSVLFVLVALAAILTEPPTPGISRWGLSLLLGGVLLWTGGSIVGTGPVSGHRSSGAGRYLRLLGGLTLAAAASVFVLGALLV